MERDYLIQHKSPEKIKEDYAKRVEAITRRNLTVENVDTYAEQALDDLIDSVDDLQTQYSKFPTVSLNGKAGEDAALEYFGINPTLIDSTLDHVSNQVRIIENIDQRMARNIKYAPIVMVPPMDQRVEIRGRDGSFEEVRKVPRLKTILFVLQSKYDIALEGDQDENKISVTRGVVSPDMMRKEPYNFVQIPELNRSILVCDEIRNATFIFDNEKLKDAGVDKNSLIHLNKDELKGLINNGEGIGYRMNYSKKFVENLIGLIDRSIPKKSTDELVSQPEDGQLLLKVEPAPEGYASLTGIVSSLGISPTVVKRAIAELGIEPAIDKAKFGYVNAPAYSPEQTAQVKEYLEAVGVLVEPAPEGYVSLNGMVSSLGIDRSVIKRAIAELGIEPVIDKAKFGSSSVPAYSPEQTAQVKEYLEAVGVLVETAPEGYVSLSGMVSSLGISPIVVKRAIAELGIEPAIDKAKFGSKSTSAYSPEQTAQVKEYLEARKESRLGGKALKGAGVTLN